MKSFINSPAIMSGGGGFYINPGTGPVESASLANARENIPHLLVDAGLDPKQVKVRHYRKFDRDGRFFFQFKFGTKTCEVDMPGLPLAEVRWLPDGIMDIWQFPRLYVDGSSWVWTFAVNNVHYSLIGDDGFDFFKATRKKA